MGGGEPAESSLSTTTTTTRRNSADNLAATAAATIRIAKKRRKTDTILQAGRRISELPQQLELEANTEINEERAPLSKRPSSAVVVAASLTTTTPKEGFQSPLIGDDDNDEFYRASAPNLDQADIEIHYDDDDFEEDTDDEREDDAQVGMEQQPKEEQTVSTSQVKEASEIKTSSETNIYKLYKIILEQTDPVVWDNKNNRDQDVDQDRRVNNNETLNEENLEDDERRLTVSSQSPVNTSLHERSSLSSSSCARDLDENNESLSLSVSTPTTTKRHVSSAANANLSVSPNETWSNNIEPVVDAVVEAAGAAESHHQQHDDDVSASPDEKTTNVNSEPAAVVIVDDVDTELIKFDLNDEPVKEAESSKKKKCFFVVFVFIFQL